MSERIDVIQKFIETSESFIKLEHSAEEIIVSNDKLKDFKFSIPAEKKNKLSEIYREKLTLWIVNKIEKKEFIPIIDRVNINPVREIQKEIKIFDQTKIQADEQKLVTLNQITIKNK